MTVNRKIAKGPGRRLTAIWVLLLGLFIAELFFYTWCRMQCVQVGYRIAMESRKNQELQSLQNSLKIELARLKAPERITQIARKRLKLELPETQQIVLVP
jgi:cell division protein FtsL